MSRRLERVNVEWQTPDDWQLDHCLMEILMDIRSELQMIRRLAECSRIPRGLDAVVRIDKRLAKAKRIKLP